MHEGKFVNDVSCDKICIAFLLFYNDHLQLYNMLLQMLRFTITVVLRGSFRLKPLRKDQTD